MARTKKGTPPAYRKHASGQAVVTLSLTNGKRQDVYLGLYGSQQSYDEYRRVITEWQANGRPVPNGQQKATTKPTDLTVNELVVAFWEHATAWYSASSREPENFRHSLKALKRLYGHTLAKEFGPLALQAVQRAMADGSWMTEEEKAKAAQRRRPIGWCRNVVNRRITRIKTLFKWATSKELIPPSTLHALESVRGLPRHTRTVRQTARVQAAIEEQVRAILPYCPPPIAAMLDLQWLTGMRCGEVRMMRTADIDQYGPVADNVQTWTYTPPQHKNDWREDEQGRVVPLGPACQRLLAAWLRPDRPQAYLLEARPGSPYTDFSYAQAVRRACRKENVRRTAGRDPTVRDRFAARIRLHPYQLRHAAKRRITRAVGLDKARAVLGHKSLGTTNLHFPRKP